MIELCGGRNIFEDLPSLAADVAPEAVLGRNPDVIIAGDEKAQAHWTFGGAGPHSRRWRTRTSISSRPSS
jgi:hypothetical protein